MDVPGDLVHGRIGGEATSQVEELPGARLGHHPDRAEDEVPVGAGQSTDAGHDLVEALSEVAVDLVVVLAAECVVVAACDARMLGVDRGGYPRRAVLRPAPVEVGFACRAHGAPPRCRARRKAPAHGPSRPSHGPDESPPGVVPAPMRTFRPARSLLVLLNGRRSSKRWTPSSESVSAGRVSAKLARRSLG